MCSGTSQLSLYSLADMKVYTTAPMEDPREVADAFSHLESLGYDGAFSFEAKHDPFLSLALAAQKTESMQVGTAIAIAFARNPMTLANIGYDMQLIAGGRFILGLGTPIRPHIEKRFSSQWSKPARRFREMVLAIRHIWEAWEGEGKLDFRGGF